MHKNGEPRPPLPAWRGQLKLAGPGRPSHYGVGKAADQDLVRFLHAAHDLAQRGFPSYSSVYSKRTFSIPQIAACLLLREYLTLDLRSLEGLLKSNQDLARTLHLKKVPDPSTLSRYERQISRDVLLSLLSKVLSQMKAQVDDGHLHWKPFFVILAKQQARQDSRLPSPTPVRKFVLTNGSGQFFLVDTATMSPRPFASV